MGNNVSGKAQAKPKKTGKKYKELKIGDTIGNLTIIEDLGITRCREHYYNCQCKECGRIYKISRRNLLLPNTECIHCKQEREFKGQIVDGYKILEMTDKRTKSRNIIWICECTKCGRKHEISSYYIRDGKMPKCKCYLFTIPQKSFIDSILL